MENCTNVYLQSKKAKDIQHQEFAGRHRPSYYSGAHLVINRRSDGIQISQVAVVVCARVSDRLGYIDKETVGTRRNTYTYLITRGANGDDTGMSFNKRASPGSLIDCVATLRRLYLNIL